MGGPWGAPAPGEGEKCPHPLCGSLPPSQQPQGTAYGVRDPPYLHQGAAASAVDLMATLSAQQTPHVLTLVTPDGPGQPRGVQQVVTCAIQGEGTAAPASP